MLAILLLADLYIPLNHNATVVKFTAPRNGATVVATCGKRTKRVPIDAGTTEMAASELCDGNVLRVADGVAITAVDQWSDATVSVPVLDSRNAITEGVIALREDDEKWTSAISFINPNEVATKVTFGGEVFWLLSGAAAPPPPLASQPRGGEGAAAPLSNQRTFSSTLPILVYRTDTNIATGARVITLATGIPPRRRAVAFPAPPVTVTPHTITLTPSKDNTLYQAIDGSLSNGAGMHLFVGVTNGSLTRRAVLAFNIGANIPPGSKVTSATLLMHVSQTINGDQPIALHALSKDWGESTSNAGISRDGSGTASKNGDATWIHTSFPNARWTNAGGDFAAAIDGTATAQAADVTWTSSASMIARVQAWVDQPSSNFGWILVGNESSNLTTKRFDSREVVPAATRPALTIQFETH